MLKILKTFYGFVLKKRLAFAGFVLLVVIATALANLTPYFYKIFVEAIPSLDYQRLVSILVVFMLIRIASSVIISFLLTLIVIKFLISLNIRKRTLFNKKEDEISGIIVDNLINFE